MKTIVALFFFSVFGLFSLQAQKSGIPLSKLKISSKLKAEINSTPVATATGRRSFKMNTRALNSRMPNGARIISMKVHFTRNKNKPFLARKYKADKVTKTAYLPLVRRGDEVFIDLSSPHSNTDCSGMPCEDCVSNIIGSGTVVCECPSGDTGDCAEDISDDVDELTNILEKVFI